MWAALEITAHETVFVHADIESSSAGIFDCCRSVFLHQGKHTQDAADTGLPLPLIDQLAELADLRSGMFGASQQLRRAERHFLGVILFLDAIPAAPLAHMFAERLFGERMQDADGTPDPSWRQTVVSGFDFHAAVQMHHAFSELVVAEGFERQWQQMWFFV